jgi:hypothetical protein
VVVTVYHGYSEITVNENGVSDLENWVVLLYTAVSSNTLKVIFVIIRISDSPLTIPHTILNAGAIRDYDS